MAKKGMYPFGGPKMSGTPGKARNVQGTSGHAKSMNKVATPSRNTTNVAVKLAASDTKAPRVVRAPAANRAGNDKVSKPQRARPL